jgi:hypothetical protein
MAFMPDDDFTEPPLPNGHVAAASAVPAKPVIAIIAVVAIEATEIAIVPIATVRSYAQVQLCQRSLWLRTNGRTRPSWIAVRDAAAAATSASFLMCLLLVPYFHINDFASDSFLSCTPPNLPHVSAAATRNPGFRGSDLEPGFGWDVFPRI